MVRINHVDDPTYAIELENDLTCLGIIYLGVTYKSATFGA